MLTKQYRRVIAGGFGEDYFAVTCIGNTDSQINGIMARNAFQNLRTTGGNNYYSYLLLGTNDTSPTENDCTWDNGVDLTPIASTRASGSEDYIYNITETFQNNTGENVTIKEVGLAIYCNYLSGVNVLLGRIVLENPITIANGETYSFHYTIC